jgi:hypothetical protein
MRPPVIEAVVTLDLMRRRRTAPDESFRKYEGSIDHLESLSAMNGI